MGRSWRGRWARRLRPSTIRIQAEVEKLAHEVLISTDAAAMKAHELKFDFILISIPECL
jgi:hypothetical protein